MSKQTVSRRSFFQYGAAALAGVASAPMNPLAAVINEMMMQQRVGLMLPETVLYAGLPGDLRQSFERAWFRRIGLTRDSAREAARDLLRSGARVLVGWVSNAQAEALQPELAERDAHLLALSAGERAGAALPNVTYATQGYWQSAALAGQWVVGRYGGRAVQVASFYESGFQTMAAFDAGVRAAGGEVVGSQVTHVTPSQPNLNEAISLIRTARPDVVYAAYSGAHAEAFLAAYRGAGLSHIPLVGAAFTVGAVDAHIQTVSAAGLGAQASAWLADGLGTPKLTGWAYDSATRTLSAVAQVRVGGQTVAQLDGAPVAVASNSGWTMPYGTL